MIRRVLLVIIAAPVIAAPVRTQSPVDSSLATYIAGIRAIDNHAHPLLPPVPGTPRDTDYDAMPLADIPPFELPAALTIGNPAWITAWHELFAYPYTDTSAAHLRELQQEKQHVWTEHGAHYAEWALDRMGTDVMLANRVSMGPGLAPPRFRWVAFVDALMYPLDVSHEGEDSPDARPLYAHQAVLLRRWLHAVGLSAPPATLDAYLAGVIMPTLERFKRQGAVAIKFEASYIRPLQFGDPSIAAARAIYARYAHGGTPPHADYRVLEDFLFRYLAREAGRLGLAVHIHCTDIAGGYYRVTGAQPIGLESVFNDTTLRRTTFVLIHGGWPFTGQTLGMLGKPNVYADISLVDDMVSPHTLAVVLRQWLEEYPDKVLYGSDAFADHQDDPVGWAEIGWLASRNARRALAIALTAMMRDGDITRDRAESIARMVLRDNAARLYGIGG